MAGRQTPKNGNWIVTMRCVVTKEVYCEGCTEEQARTTPWEYARDETETSQEDWDVKSVERNE